MTMRWTFLWGWVVRERTRAVAGCDRWLSRETGAKAAKDGQGANMGSSLLPLHPRGSQNGTSYSPTSAQDRHSSHS